MDALSSYDTGRLIYLGLLLAMIAGYFFVAHRGNLGQSARQAALWVLIFIGVIAGVGLWEDIRTDVIPRQSSVIGEGRIEVPRAFDGHYYLTLRANGRDVEFVVDTGATDIVLSQSDAAKIGIDPDTLIYSGMASTANGIVRTAKVNIASLEIGDITDRNIEAWINEGELETSLLGMAYLQRFERFEIVQGRLTLER